jgi:hypothetical protein
LALIRLYRLITANDEDSHRTLLHFIAPLHLRSNAGRFRAVLWNKLPSRLPQEEGPAGRRPSTALIRSLRPFARVKQRGGLAINSATLA